ncbi:hypothetical protein CsSME_00008070 [Camellia sinensis var. sinensis]
MGLGISFVTDWVNRWWRALGNVKVLGVGGHYFLFVFPLSREAVSVLQRKWTIAGHDLAPTKAQSNWIQVIGLPIHLHGLVAYQAFGNRCGGFLEVDETTDLLGCVRLKVRGLAIGILPRISLRWGLWHYSLPVWSEIWLTVESASLTAATWGGSGTRKEGADLVQRNR